MNKKLCFHFPKNAHPVIQVWDRVMLQDSVWRGAHLSNMQIQKLITVLRQNQKKYLSSLSMHDRILILDEISRAWLSKKSPYRSKAEAILPKTTGCSQAVISEGLKMAFRGIKKNKMDLVHPLIQELPKPRLSLFSFAGIIPTPMLFDFALATLMGSSMILKSPSREPIFPILLAQSLCEIIPDLAESVAAFWWKGGKTSFETTLFDNVDLIHAYGDDATIHSIKARVTKKHLAVFGHKVSISVIRPSNFDPGIYDRAARDIIFYNQQGCLSPHVIYIISRDMNVVRVWAHHLARSIEKIEKKYPTGELTLSEMSLIHQFRGENFSRKNVKAFSSHPTSRWTVIFDPNSDFSLSCLNRCIFVKPISSLNLLTHILDNAGVPLQSIGFCASLNEKSLKKIAQSHRIPVLSPVGKMQNLSFENHIQERLNHYSKMKFRNWEKK